MHVYCKAPEGWEASKAPDCTQGPDSITLQLGHMEDWSQPQFLHPQTGTMIIICTQRVGPGSNGPLGIGAASGHCLAPHHPPPSPKAPLWEPAAPDRGILLTWLRTQVGVKALRLEHDEQRAPSQEDCREEEVFQHSRAGHPPAAPMGSGQGGRHGAVWRRRRPGSGSADTCAQTSASAVAPYPTRVAAGAQRPDCQPPGAQAVGARRRRIEPHPCLGPGPP